MYYHRTMNTLVRRLLSRGLNFRKDNLTLLSSTVPSALRQVRWLPVCSVLTNLQSEKVPNDFEQGLSKVLSEVLSKPEKVGKLMAINYTPYNYMLIPGQR